MALCSVSSNPLTGFTKHLQTDRGLQRDRLVKRNGTGYQGFKTGTRQHNQAANEFVQFNAPSPDLLLSDYTTRQRQLEFEAQPSPQWSGPYTSRLLWTSEFSSGNFGIKTGPVPQHLPYRSEEQNTHSSQRLPPSVMSVAGQKNPNPHTRSDVRYAYPWTSRWGQFQSDNEIGMDWTSPLSTLPEQTQFASVDLETTMEDFDWEALFASLDTTTQTMNANTGPLGLVGQESSAVLNTFVDNEVEDLAALPVIEQPSVVAKDENVSHNDRFADGMLIVTNGDNLSLAALAFEDACRVDPMHFEAWRMLGSVLAQIGRESAAIQAFKEALKLEPTSIDVIMKLAVSYTNEGTYDLACQSLEQWLKMKYPRIPIPKLESLDTPPSDSELRERIKEPFIQAARLSLEEEVIDADVQVGLGVLMFSAELYEMAADCFHAAIQATEPGSLNFGTQWHVLWNRYAACLGNTKDKEVMAISAYETALAAKPNFVKARHNLGVLYHNINEPLLGARNILEALRWNRIAGSTAGNKTRDFLSDSDETTDDGMHQDDAMDMYENLSKCCTSMCRWDLAELVGQDMDFDRFELELDGC